MKDQPGFSSIDEYIRLHPAPVQKKLTALRRLIRQQVPDAEEKIGYQMPAFQLNGALVYFAAHETHIGFYPTPSGISRFKRELSGYVHSKGAVQFPLDEPLPVELIKKIVRFRAAENLEKAKKKKGK